MEGKLGWEGRWGGGGEELELELELELEIEGGGGGGGVEEHVGVVVHLLHLLSNLHRVGRSDNLVLLLCRRAPWFGFGLGSGLGLGLGLGGVGLGWGLGLGFTLAQFGHEGERLEARA